MPLSDILPCIVFTSSGYLKLHQGRHCFCLATTQGRLKYKSVATEILESLADCNQTSQLVRAWDPVILSVWQTWMHCYNLKLVLPRRQQPISIKFKTCWWLNHTWITDSQLKVLQISMQRFSLKLVLPFSWQLYHKWCQKVTTLF